MKIVLVTIDTLRADRLGCYGYDKPTTPNMDSLAESSILFRDAFTPCTYTVPTHYGILTGRYPSNLSVFFRQGFGALDTDREVMLQEVLTAKGYETAAFVGAMVLRKEWGFDAGFGVYDDKTTTSEKNRPEELFRPGEETNRALFSWIRENKDRDFFVWTHYFDVHGPYVSPEPFASTFRPEYYGPDPVMLPVVRDGRPGGIPRYQALGMGMDEGGEIAGREQDARVYLAGYDSGVRHLDDIVGRLVEELKTQGIFDDTMLVVTADHGEALGEDGVWFFHGLTVTPEQARVPLLIKLPGGLRAGEVVEGPVSTVDIFPTALEVAGLDARRFELDGESLLSARKDDGRSVFCENEWQRGIARGKYMLVREKKVSRDGFTYYFDSKELCAGDRLLTHRDGRVVEGARDDDAVRLWELSDMYARHVDPKEVSIRIDDRDIITLEGRARYDGARISGMQANIDAKDSYIAELQGRVSSLTESAIARDEELRKACQEASELRDLAATKEYERAVLQERVESMEVALKSMEGSLSWRLTAPLRRVSGKLKGIG